MEKKIGAILIVVIDKQAANTLQAVLGDHSGIILARQGVNLEQDNFHVLTIIMKGTQDEMNALTGKLGKVRGIKVRSVSLNQSNE